MWDDCSTTTTSAFISVRPCVPRENLKMHVPRQIDPTRAEQSPVMIELYEHHYHNTQKKWYVRRKEFPGDVRFIDGQGQIVAEIRYMLYRDPPNRLLFCLHFIYPNELHAIVVDPYYFIS
jgi:hypothetical protein